MTLKDRLAMVTGATGVIGGEIVRRFLSAGARVLAVGRRTEALETFKNRSADGRLETFRADVSAPEDMRALMAFAATAFGRLDVLVTAAGVYGEIGALEQIDEDAWMTAFRVNVFGTMLAVKGALPLLKKSEKGKIITFAGGGDGPLPRFTSYASSKGAVVRLTESLAAELLETGIEINAISPGLVNSGFVHDLLAAGPERVGVQKYQEALDQTLGAGVTVGPDKAAALAVFLASRASDGMTGKNISAVWDDWRTIPEHLRELSNSDVYNWRRIKPKDRWYAW